MVCEHLDAICHTVLFRKRVRAINIEKLTNSKKKKEKENHLITIQLTVLVLSSQRIFAHTCARKSRRMTVNKERDTEGRPYRTLKILFYM